MIGTSESRVVVDDRYELCDVVVETGATMLANDLEVFAEILSKDQVMLGLYGRKK